MSKLLINLLGGFRAQFDDGEPLSLSTKKAQALFAYLAMRPDQPQARDKVATLLWGDSGEEQARHSLRQTLVNLRKSLSAAADSILVSEGDTLSLSKELIRVDAVDFQRLAEANDEERLEEAASLYVGDLLDGFNVNEELFEEWLLSERDRLRELAQEVLARLLGIYSKSEKLDLAVRTGSRLLALDPLQEIVHRSLMDLYTRQGRREAALKQYQTCVALLERELGMEPEEETKQVYENILRQTPRKQTAGRRPAAPGSIESILVVEDDAVTRALIEGFLGGNGYQQVHAADGADALLELGKRSFDLMLLDLNMPTLDGLKLLEIMNEKQIRIPVICLTALTGDQVEIRAFELGAADFIRKPIQKEVLLMRVKNVLKMSAA